MGRSVRRSTRAPASQSQNQVESFASSFQVGDVVEIERNGERLQARLVRSLSTPNTTPSRWLVCLSNNKEELEVNETELLEPTTTESNTDSSSNINTVSAREARVRRRQEAEAKDKKKRKGTTAAATTNKRQRTTEQECVKIKLLTGTLLLYRGQNRRAEFIRRV